MVISSYPIKATNWPTLFPAFHFWNIYNSSMRNNAFTQEAFILCSPNQKENLNQFIEVLCVLRYGACEGRAVPASGLLCRIFCRQAVWCLHLQLDQIMADLKHKLFMPYCARYKVLQAIPSLSLRVRPPAHRHTDPALVICYSFFLQPVFDQPTKFLLSNYQLRIQSTCTYLL